MLLGGPQNTIKGHLLFTALFCFAPFSVFSSRMSAPYCLKPIEVFYCPPSSQFGLGHFDFQSLSILPGFPTTRAWVPVPRTVPVTPLQSANRESGSLPGPAHRATESAACVSGCLG
jgi:hypothetical protein